MKKIICIWLIITYSCAPTDGISDNIEKRCESASFNSYEKIVEESSHMIFNGNNLHYNEVRFECVKSPLISKKVMYDKFGKWNSKIDSKREESPILIWKNVQLFPTDSTRFTVAANGMENEKKVFASVIVLDQENKDLLSHESEYKELLINYFSAMILTHDQSKRIFYKIYWTEVDPQKWRKLKHYIYP